MSSFCFPLLLKDSTEIGNAREIHKTFVFCLFKSCLDFKNLLVDDLVANLRTEYKPIFKDW